MIQHAFAVRCEQVGCPAKYLVLGLTIRQTRAAATRAGWTRDHGHDYCPDHRIVPDVSRQTSRDAADGVEPAVT